MYILNGVELNLDKRLLEEYSKIIVAPVGSVHFNESLKLIVETELKQDFKKALFLYGPDVVARKIMIAIEDELSFIKVEYS